MECVELRAKANIPRAYLEERLKDDEHHATFIRKLTEWEGTKNSTQGEIMSSKQVQQTVTAHSSEAVEAIPHTIARAPMSARRAPP